MEMFSDGLVILRLLSGIAVCLSFLYRIHFFGIVDAGTSRFVEMRRSFVLGLPSGSL